MPPPHRRKVGRRLGLLCHRHQHVVVVRRRVLWGQGHLLLLVVLRALRVGIGVIGVDDPLGGGGPRASPPHRGGVAGRAARSRRRRERQRSGGRRRRRGDPGPPPPSMSRGRPPPLGLTVGRARERTSRASPTTITATWDARRSEFSASVTGAAGAMGCGGGEGEVGREFGGDSAASGSTLLASCAAAGKKGVRGGERRWWRRDGMVRRSGVGGGEEKPEEDRM